MRNGGQKGCAELKEISHIHAEAYAAGELNLNSSVAHPEPAAKPVWISYSPSPPEPTGDKCVASPIGRGNFLPSPRGRRAGDEGGGVTMPLATLAKQTISI